jgi:hypothetical protein
MPFTPVNTKILSHPLNWIQVFLMLTIAGVAGHFVMSYFDREPATQPTSGYSNIPAGFAAQAPFQT